MEINLHLIRTNCNFAGIGQAHIVRDPLDITTHREGTELFIPPLPLSPHTHRPSAVPRADSAGRAQAFHKGPWPPRQ